MSDYELGYRVGGALVALLITVILWRIASPTRIESPFWRRLIRTGVLVLGVAIVVRRPVDSQRTLDEFQLGCVHGCAKQASGNAERCQRLCDCQIQALTAGRSKDDAVAWMNGHGLKTGHPDSALLADIKSSAETCAKSLVLNVRGAPTAR